MPAINYVRLTLRLHPDTCLGRPKGVGMSFLLQVLILLSLSANAEPVALKIDATCAFQAVAGRMKITIAKDIELPKVYLASDIALSFFQDVIEAEWLFRPDVVTNVFAPKANAIFLTNEGEVYKAHGRFLEDSLAHELAHFIQVRYFGATPGNDDAFEDEAVRVQTWFREVYMKTGKSPCASDPLLGS